MLDQFHLFICQASAIPLVFLYPFHHPRLWLFLKIFLSAGPCQRDTFRRLWGQAAVDEEEEAEAGERCGSKGRPLSQEHDQSQEHRSLHPQYVGERSGRHNGHWSGKARGTTAHSHANFTDLYHVKIMPTALRVSVIDLYKCKKKKFPPKFLPVLLSNYTRVMAKTLLNQ